MEQSVTVLHSSPSGWTNNTTSLDQCLKNPDAPKHQYILVQNDPYSGGYQLSPELIEYFQIPGHMLSNVYRSSNGFFYWDESYDNAGHLDAHYTCFRFLVKMIKHKPSVSYLWHEVSFFTRWTPDSCTVLCVAAPESMLHGLKDVLGNLWSKLPPSEPYVLHVLIFEVIIALQDASVWSMRDILRNEEKSFLIPSRKSSDFTLLHESRRHFIHSMETLSVAVEILEAIKKQHSTLSSKLGPSIRKPVDTSFRIQAHLEAQTIMLKNLFLRSQSNKERLQNEIGYGENKAVRRDSSAMRTIAVVTMAFLPPTFISAIFSMSFFEFSPPGDGKPGKWSVSEKFWLYWAITIPLITLTMTVWYWREGNYYTFFQKTASIPKRTKSRF